MTERQTDPHDWCDNRGHGRCSAAAQPTVAVPLDVFEDALNTVDAYGYDGLARTLLDLARASGHPLDDIETPLEST